MSERDIPAIFIQYATDILGDTNTGLSGSDIIKATVAYAIEYGVSLPHSSYPFDSPNKRTALFENLMVFDSKQKYRIIKELCDHSSFSFTGREKKQPLKIKLATKYSHLVSHDSTSEINETLIEETRHWLDGYPASLKLYNDALAKYESGIFHRNLLDDLRLSLERLLRGVFVNNKSLENQIKFVGGYIKKNGGSKELANMFVKLVEYYTNYQNSYVKHDSAVIEEEIEFVFEITSSFMKHLVRISAGTP